MVTLELIHPLSTQIFCLMGFFNAISRAYALITRLHGHAIFGVVSVLDMCRTPKRVRIAEFQCPASVLFFFFFFFRFSDTRWHGSDASDTPAVKEKKENFGIFRVIPAIPANFGRNENFVRYKILTEKKKKKNQNQNQNSTSSFWVSCLISVSSSS